MVTSEAQTDYSGPFLSAADVHHFKEKALADMQAMHEQLQRQQASAQSDLLARVQAAYKEGCEHGARQVQEHTVKMKAELALLQASVERLGVRQSSIGQTFSGR